MPSEVSTVGGDPSVEELRRELAEAREQQAATAGILAAISNSPTDAHRVFAEIAASAARLCDAYDAVILQVDGDVLRVVGHYGSIPTPGDLSIANGTVMGRTVLERRTIHVADLQTQTTEYPVGSDFALRLGFRTQLVVPLIRTGEAIGVMAIRRSEVFPFTDRQIDLFKTFADQAVIAIENARLFEDVQARTRDLTEALEQQTATSEVLEVISRSPSGLGPVLEAANGQAGIATAKSDRPDLILMDIQMPVLDGYEATRQIKADPDLKATPIIAVSSFAMKGDEEKARAAGCDHYVTKPYSPMQLLRAIREYLGDKS